MDSEWALEEAHRRWGERGSLSMADTFRNSKHLVGELMPGPRFVVRGRGSSWAAAFADADARASGASRRSCATGSPLWQWNPT